MPHSKLLVIFGAWEQSSRVPKIIKSFRSGVWWSGVTVTTVTPERTALPFSVPSFKRGLPSKPCGNSAYTHDRADLADIGALAAVFALIIIYDCVVIDDVDSAVFAVLFAHFAAYAAAFAQ